jgi:hypothetical protein
MDDLKKGQASDKEKFELLHGMLIKYYDGLFDGTMKAAGVLIIVAGWLATSDSLSNLLNRSIWLRYFAIAAVVLGYAVYLRVAYLAYKISNDTFCYLEELDYMDSRYYAHQRIRLSKYVLYGVANLVLTTGIVILVLKR